MKTHGWGMRTLLVCIFAAVCVMFAGLWRASQPRIQTVPSSSAAVSQGRAVYGQLPLAFEPNAGQFAKNVEFVAHANGFELILRGSQATIAEGAR